MKESPQRSGRAVKKNTKLKKVVRSSKLHLYAHLTPEQLEFVKGSTGEGLSSVFTTEGRRSLKFLRRLSSAKNKCPKFVLYSTELGRLCYVANKKLIWDKLKEEEKLWPAHITFDVKEALLFYEGFDNPEDKLKFFNLKMPKLKFQTKLL